MPLNINSEVIMGVILVGFGVLTFAKGTSQHIAQNNYIRSAQEVSKLVDTATSVHNISNTTKKNSILEKNN